MMTFLAELVALHKQRSINHIEQVHLVWVNPTTSPFQTWFPELLGDLASFGAPFHLHLYATGSKGRRGETASVIASTGSSTISALTHHGISQRGSVELSAINSIDTLPDGWTECRDEASGQVYYFHAQSEVTQWERPSPPERAIHMSSVAKVRVLFGRLSVD
jgi:hypothetical protein